MIVLNDKTKLLTDKSQDESFNSRPVQVKESSPLPENNFLHRNRNNTNVSRQQHKHRSYLPDTMTLSEKKIHDDLEGLTQTIKVHVCSDIEYMLIIIETIAYVWFSFIYLTK